MTEFGFGSPPETIGYITKEEFDMMDIKQLQKRINQLEAELDIVITNNNAIVDDNDQLRVENETLREEIKKLRDLLYSKSHHNIEM